MTCPFSLSSEHLFWSAKVGQHRLWSEEKKTHSVLIAFTADPLWDYPNKSHTHTSFPSSQCRRTLEHFRSRCKMEFECYVISGHLFQRRYLSRGSLTRNASPSMISPKSWAISSKLSSSTPLFSALEARLPPVNGRWLFAHSVLALCLLRLNALMRSSLGSWSIGSASAMSSAERPAANPVEWDRERSSESRFPPEAYIMRTWRASTGGARLEWEKVRLCYLKLYRLGETYSENRVVSIHAW